MGRELVFLDMIPNQPIVARCSACQRLFVSKSRDAERDDDAILRMRAEFNAHICSGKA